MKVGEKCPICDWEEKVEGQHEPGGGHCWHRVRMLMVTPARSRIRSVIELLEWTDKRLEQAEKACQLAREREDARNPPDA